MTAEARECSGVRPQRRELLLLLAGLAAFGSLSIAMYLPGLPAMAIEFGAPIAAVQDTLASFSMGLCLGQLIYGPVSDRWGRRGPLLFGIALFIGASLACLIVASLKDLVIMRFVQGLGGCAGVVISRAIVRDRFSAREAATIYSTLMLILGAAPILSPLAGGWIIALLGWRAIFWLLCGFGVLLGLWVLMRFDESSSQVSRERARAEHPVRAYLAILRDWRVLAFVLCGAFGSAGTFVYMTASSHLLIDRYGVEPTMFGWFYGAGALSVLIGSQVNRWLLRRHNSRKLLTWSTRLNTAAAVLLIASVIVWPTAVWAFVIPLCLAFLMNGLSMPNSAAEAMAASGWRGGAVAAVMGFMQFGLGAGAAWFAARFLPSGPVGVAALLAVFGALAAVCVSLADEPLDQGPEAHIAEASLG